MAVSLKPEILFEIGSFPVTNSFVSALIIVGVVGSFCWIFSSKISINPRSTLQLLVEWVIDALNTLAESIMGKKITKFFFPFILTFFIFIILANWFGLTPLTGSIGFAHHSEKGGKPILTFSGGKGLEHEESSKLSFSNEYEIAKPLLRSPSADLNFTIALAIISFILIQYSGLSGLGLTYLKKFFDYRVKILPGWKIILTPLLFVGNFAWKVLETIMELVRIVTFSFRLFGNIFAGEVLLFVVLSLTYMFMGLTAIPFVGLEFFVGFIQAMVFVFLTMVFMKVAREAH